MTRSPVAQGHQDARRMGASMRTGVYLCQTGTGDLDAVRPPLDRRLRRQPAQRGAGPDLGVHAQARPRDAGGGDPAPNGLERVVIAGDSPGFFKPAFTRPWRSPAATPTRCGWPRSAQHGASCGIGTARAKSILACAVLGVPFPLAAVPDTTADASRHARHRGRRRRHPGGPRDRRRRQAGLPGRADRHHRRPHGDVRQDLPDARLRRLHPHARRWWPSVSTR